MKLYTVKLYSIAIVEMKIDIILDKLNYGDLTRQNDLLYNLVQICNNLDRDIIRQTEVG